MGEAGQGRIAPRAARAVTAAVLASLLAAAAAAPDPYPRRKPGLWEVKAASAQASGLPPTQHCVGEQTDVPDTHLDRSVGTRGACTLGAFKRAGLAWLAESVCREGRTTVVSRAIASGDLDSEYRIDTVVTYDPPLGGVRREDKEAIVARWAGPCASGQKPGDMVVPGMGTLNMVDGSFRAEPSPRPVPARPRAKH